MQNNIEKQITEDINESIEKLKGISVKFVDDLTKSTEPWQYVVRAHAYIDMSLGHAIQISLKNQEAIKANDFQSMNFPLKLALVEGLGVITPEEKATYSLFNNIRNVYNHNPIMIPSLSDEMRIYDAMPKDLRDSLFSNLVKQSISENDVKETYKKLRQEQSRIKRDKTMPVLKSHKPKYLKEISIVLLGFIWGKVMTKEFEESIRSVITRALGPQINEIVNASGGK